MSRAAQSSSALVQQDSVEAGWRSSWGSLQPAQWGYLNLCQLLRYGQADTIWQRSASLIPPPRQFQPCSALLLPRNAPLPPFHSPTTPLPPDVSLTSSGNQALPGRCRPPCQRCLLSRCNKCALWHICSTLGECRDCCACLT